MGITIDTAILRVEHSSMSVDDKETADCIINTMRKYQKIQEIHKKWFCDYTSAEAYTKISEVLEDGNDDN